jgi:tetratricopeptide (TPR) repeat protein
MGHWDESIGSFERAADLDPRNVGVLQNIAGNYATLGRYPEQKMWLRRILTFEPDDTRVQAILSAVDFEADGDTGPLHRTIDSIRTTYPASEKVVNIVHWWLICALAERDAEAAKNALDAAGDNPIDLGHDLFPSRLFIEGVIARMANDEEKAKSAFSAARIQQEKIVQDNPDFASAWCTLGLIDAALGRKEEALREGLHATVLMPADKDAVSGPAFIKYFAMIAAWTGEKDLACQQLARIAHAPSPLSYGHLRLLPFWDPLRGDRRFETIVASLAPKKASP